MKDLSDRMKQYEKTFSYKVPNRLPVIIRVDGRAFTVPVNEVANVFLWRAKDWARNSLQMYIRAFFSHKELNGKKMKDMHEMLHKKGLNWSSDISSREKNGCFIIKSDNQLFTRTDITPTYENIRLSLPESIFS